MRASFVLLAGLLSVAPALAAEGPTPSAAELGSELLARVLAPVDAALRASDAPLAIALVAPPGTTRDPLVEAIGNFFHDRGYEVFTAPSPEQLPADVPRLDVERQSTVYDLPRSEAGALGFGRRLALRRAGLGLRLRLEDPSTGRWIYRGSPRAQIEDWIDHERREALATDRPAWLGKGAALAPPARAPWWEKGIVAGLLTGVVVLYFDGTR